MIVMAQENKRIAARYTMIKAFGQGMNFHELGRQVIHDHYAGSFGTVFEATDSSNNNERVAIKKIVQDKRYKVRYHGDGDGLTAAESRASNNEIAKVTSKHSDAEGMFRHHRV